MSTPAVSVPSVDQVESRVARDLTRHALLVAPLAILGVGLWRGVDGALGVALALIVVCANFLLSAALARVGRPPLAQPADGHRPRGLPRPPRADHGRRGGYQGARHRRLPGVLHRADRRRTWAC